MPDPTPEQIEEARVAWSRAIEDPDDAEFMLYARARARIAELEARQHEGWEATGHAEVSRLEAKLSAVRAALAWMEQSHDIKTPSNELYAQAIGKLKEALDA